MKHIPPHWEPDHPAVQAWLDRPPTVRERTQAMRDRRGIPQPTGRNRRIRLTIGFILLLIAGTAVENHLDTALVLMGIASVCFLPELFEEVSKDW